jgi:hypothetical protein
MRGFLVVQLRPVDNLRRRDALKKRAPGDSLCARANAAGCYPSKLIRPTGAFLGNFSSVQPCRRHPKRCDLPQPVVAEAAELNM